MKTNTLIGLMMFFLSTVTALAQEEPVEDGPAKFEVTVLNVPSEIQTCEKFELTFQIEDLDQHLTSHYDKINAEIVEIKCKFTHSSIAITVNAFYARMYDFENLSCSTVTSSMNAGITHVTALNYYENGTPDVLEGYDGVWLARFLPKVAGEWAYEISGTVYSYLDENFIEVELTSGEFEIQSGLLNCYDYYFNHKPGILHKNGVPVIPIGESIANDESQVLNTTPALNNGSLYRPIVQGGVCLYKEAIDELHAKGGNYFRINLLQLINRDEKVITSSTLYPLVDTNQGPFDFTDILLDYSNLQRFDIIFEYARSKEIAVKPIATTKDLFGFQDDVLLPYNPFRFFAHGENKELYNLQNTELQLLLRNWLRYIISRYGYLDNIMAVQLMNEPWNVKDTTKVYITNAQVRSDMIEWYCETVSYLKSLKPTLLVSTGWHAEDLASTVPEHQAFAGVLSSCGTDIDIIDVIEGVHGNSCYNWDDANIASTIFGYTPDTLTADIRFNSNPHLIRKHNYTSWKMHKIYNYDFNVQYDSFWGGENASGGDESFAGTDPYGFSYSSYLYSSFFSGSFASVAPLSWYGDMHNGYSRSKLGKVGPISCTVQEKGYWPNYTTSNLYKYNNGYWLNSMEAFKSFTSELKYVDEHECYNNLEGGTNKIRIYNFVNPSSTITFRYDAYVCYEKTEETNVYLTGYVMDTSYSLSELYVGGRYDYVRNLNPAQKPSHETNLFAVVEVPYAGCYKVRFFRRSTSALTELSSAYPMSYVENGKHVILFDLPTLNGDFGDITFTAENTGIPIQSFGNVTNVSLDNLIVNCLTHNPLIQLGDFCENPPSTERRLCFEIGVFNMTNWQVDNSYPVKYFCLDYTDYSAISSFYLNDLFSLTSSFSTWPANWQSNGSYVDYQCSIGSGSCITKQVLPTNRNYYLKVASYYPWRENYALFNFIDNQTCYEDTDPGEEEEGLKAGSPEATIGEHKSILLNSSNAVHTFVQDLINDTGSGARYHLVNTLGQQVSYSRDDFAKLSLSSAGIYYLLVHDGAKQQTFKILVTN